MEQLNFFNLTSEEQQKKIESNLEGYDYFIVAFSGGKDSTAAFLHLLNLGVDPAKIELWHHDTLEQGQPFEAATEERIQAAQSDEFNQPIFLENFSLPAAAFGDAAGPT